MEANQLEPHKEPLYHNYFVVIAAGFLFFVAEYIIKNLVIIKLGSGGVATAGPFMFHFVANDSMAFSLPVNQLIIVIASLLILYGLIKYFTVCCRDGLYGNVWALNFVIWGAFSNIYDRISRGFVVDYIDIGLWPVFNLSDAAIVVGLVSLLILISVREKRLSMNVAEA